MMKKKCRQISFRRRMFKLGNLICICCFWFYLLNFITSVDLDNYEEVDSFSSKKSKMIYINRSDLMPIKTGPCNIPVEYERISHKEFLDKYAFKYPVIFRKLNENRPFKENCELKTLFEKYGKKRITVSSANTYSYSRSSMYLEDYLVNYVLKKNKCESNEDCNRKLSQIEDVELSEKEIIKYGNETWYFFGENNYTEWKELFDMYERPSYNLPLHEHAYSFGIASTYSGVPFHFHGPGFAETVWGRKRWFLYEPSKKPKFDPDMSTTQWFLEEYNRLKEEEKPLECILEEHDVIYFPDKWWHATLNLDPITIFISTFLSPMIRG